MCCKGYDSFIDFLKGICILLIILTHCISPELKLAIGFPFWGSLAVPIFLIIQVFHFYKKGVDEAKTDFSKVWRRVARPFFIVEFVLFALWLYNDCVTNAFALPTFKDSLFMLAGGPGSYYPWIYIQFAFFLPLFKPLLKIRLIYTFIAFLIISQFSEIICKLSDMPEWIYRLTFFRYVFLVFLGFLLATKGYVLKWTTVLMSVISLASVFFFTYTKIDCAPFFYNVEAWSTCHWICYIYISFLAIVGLKYVFLYIQNTVITTHIKLIGIYSYEIYLFQLVYFTYISEYVNNCLSIIGNSMMNIIVSVILCVVPVYIYKKMKTVLKRKIRNSSHNYSS